MEHRRQNVCLEIWRAEGVTQQQLDRSLRQAKNAYFFLAGKSLFDPSLPQDIVTIDVGYENAGYHNCVTLPLAVGQFPAFGVLQLEASTQLNENDLEFVDALASLISVAVDRFYSSSDERIKSSSQLVSSQAHVADLEVERGLRESFVSMMSHDLRTPLSAARMAAQLIQLDQGSNLEIQDLADRIITNVSRADQMIRDLLDANRIRSGERLPLLLEACNMGDLLKETLKELTEVHGDRFVMDVQNSVKGYWDSGAIRRVVENLCNNAIKYGNISTKVTVKLHSDDVNFYLDIQNWGDPISAEDQLSLFQQYRRVSSSDVQAKKSWGIGLTLVRGVAEAHGGTVRLLSNVETGTIFCVVIPLDARQ
ncbi:MAG: GAF domain-containing sensor histidine kinase [Bdellovibrionaceae bacterium]|nr:GAF domain-containing sensor histidine kinase [Pseudobdellovibrionaceae bacterium]